MNDRTAPAHGGLLRPVVLIGLMGAGKSSVGHKLAELLKVGFCDSDAEVERAAGMTVAEIFERYGEPSFRDGERKVLARLVDGPARVIATGGGAWMNAETRAAIRGRAVSVWLKADLDTLVARTAGRSHRPILNTGDPREILARLISERYPVYGLADCTVESLREQSHEAMARRILKALKAYGRRTEPVIAEGTV
ncbi:MAG: shikimate kinase [Pikeienuella sp.]